MATLQGGTFALPTLASGQFYEITVTATVTAASGSVTNTATVAAPGGTTDPNNANNSASDTDTVASVLAPTISKNFGASSIALNSSTSLTFTLSNPNTGASLSGIGFTDSLPAGMVVSTPNGLSNTCGGTPTAAAGSGSVSLSGATLATSGSCSFAVNVTGTGTGAKANTTGTISSTESGVGSTSNTANLTVVGPPTISKNFGSSSILVNTSTTLTFNISNPNGGTSLTGVGFTDTLPTGMVVSNPNGLTGACPSGTITATQTTGSVSLSGATLAANGSCSFTVNVTATAAGNLNNITGNVTSANGGTGGTANASITVTGGPISISGNITYGGAQTGRIFIRVYDSGCTGGNCNELAGTSIAAVAPGAYPVSYTINGLQASGNGGNGGGNFLVTAEMDTLNTGLLNAQNPSCYVGVNHCFSVTGATSNIPNANLVLGDRTTAVQAPSLQGVAGGDPLAVVQYQAPTDNNGEEIATSYNVYYGTDPSLTSPSIKNFAAQGSNQNVFFLSGFNTGSSCPALCSGPGLAGGSYYFKMTAIVGGTESSASTVSGPVTIGPQSGGHTVSGTVTFPSPSNGPVYVGVFSEGGGVYGSSYPIGTTSPLTYSVTGVAPGTYSNFAIIDSNNNGEIDVPDVNNAGGNNSAPTITVTSSDVPGSNITLVSAPTTLTVTTSHQQFNGTGDSYSLNLGLAWGTKRPVAMQLTSGPNVFEPWDLPVDSNNGLQIPNFNGALPVAGQIYTFHTTFSDLTTADLQASVTAVVTTLPQNLVASTTAPGTQTIPNFTWTNAGIPAADTYSVSVNGGNVNWSYPRHSNGITNLSSVLYNVDGQASSPSLSLGTTYFWSVQVSDANGNQATQQTTYTPGGPVLSSVILNPSAVIGPATSQVTVTLTGPAPGSGNPCGAQVTLLSDNTAVATVSNGGNVCINSGTTTSFPITVNTSSVLSQAVAHISASYNSTTLSATLTVAPTGTLLISSLTLSPGTIVGGDTSTLNKVTLNRAVVSGDGTVTVTLLSGNTSLATVPASVTVALGQTTSPNFSIVTSAVVSQTPVSISATLSGLTQTNTLNVNPPVAITTTQLPLGAVGAAYPTTNLTKSGGVGAVSYAVFSGNLPTGMSPINTPGE